MKIKNYLIGSSHFLVHFRHNALLCQQLTKDSMDLDYLIFFVAAEVIAEGSVENALKEKHYKEVLGVFV